jgi:hypothetical protein
MSNNTKINLYLTNIIIFDWDDTLFPTSWLNTNDIKLNEENVNVTYKIYFQELDKSIYNLLKSYNKISTIYIVTNASMKWIKASLNTLPLTRKLIIKENIRIISSRDMYSKKNNSITEWKLNTFESIINNDLKNIFAIKNKEIILNIISMGDAVYEYIALVNLHDILKKKIDEKKNINFYLKNIRFKHQPNFDFIIEQIDLVNKNKFQIINEKNYIDKEIMK